MFYLLCNRGMHKLFAPSYDDKDDNSDKFNFGLKCM
jgi:hypothetical protein